MQSIRRTKLSSPSTRSGAAAVEMAMVSPVLFTLILGILQVGYAFMAQHALQDAARRGCRVATLRSVNRSNSTVTSTINSQLQSEGINIAKTTITILLNNHPGDVSQAQAGDDVCVKVTMALSDATLFPGYFDNFTGTMQGAATQRCE